MNLNRSGTGSSASRSTCTDATKEDAEARNTSGRRAISSSWAPEGDPTASSRQPAAAARQALRARCLMPLCIPCTSPSDRPDQFDAALRSSCALPPDLTPLFESLRI